jgi:general secretion pathway protein A
MDRQEVKTYVEHRLVVAGCRGKVRFTTGALSAIYAYSQGNPRRINAVCDRALLIAYCKNEFEISRDTIVKASNDIEGSFKDYDTRTRWFQNRLAPATAVILAVFIVANLGGWSLKDQISGLFSAMEKAAMVQSKAFVRKPVEFEKTAVIQSKPFVVEPMKTQEPVATLVLDERTSLNRLFRLFNVQEAQTNFAAGDIYPGLFSFEGDPQLYRMFVRPFRLRINSDSGDEPGYLLIRRVTNGGGIVLDAQGKERPVTEDFMLAHWDGEMSWVYPYEHMNGKLSEGMSSLGVLRIQQVLQHLGYSVEPRGVYDRTTFNEVMRFQLNFGLKADGIVDTQTKALLYQMSG